MCGLIALWGRSDIETIQQLLPTLHHRGPDGRAVHADTGGPGATLGHTRLAIIDPAGGHQPLVAEDGSALVCNGMIYNDLALRKRIGHEQFQTKTDSESVLRGYMRWGTRVVDQLDGMFAFVVIDGAGHCVAARDRLGKKPLYWGRLGDSIAFASEIKSLAGVAADIEPFPAGCVWHSDTGLRRYYELPPAQTGERAERDNLDAVRRGLERAVTKRMRSDVPLGAFLSGGLDSSVIAALARQHVDELHTFAVGLPGSSDLDAARRVATHLDTIHHEYIIDPDEIGSVLPRVVAHLESYDGDLVRSAVPTWFVARLAASHGMKVVLTGEGADELFAGYSYFADYDDPAVLQNELRRSLGAMHDVNLQRVDRMTMAHSLEARVPFLDPEMVRIAMATPADLKQRPEQGCDGEKWILRKACEDLVPTDIVWRGKLQFDQGSGFSDYLDRHARGEYQAGRTPTANREADAEETLYRGFLADAFGGCTDVIDALTSHWRSGRTADRNVA